VNETSDSVSSAAGKTLARERNERCSKQRGGQGVGNRKKRAIQRAARRARRQQEKETRDAASGVAGKASARERNERFSEWCSRQDVGERKQRAMQRTARRAGHQPVEGWMTKHALTQSSKGNHLPFAQASPGEHYVLNEPAVTADTHNQQTTSERNKRKISARERN
jgi:hypothetical protein